MINSKLQVGNDMNLIKIKYLTLNTILFIVTSLLFTNVTYANESDTELRKMCDRQSIIIAAELRQQNKGEFTAQDMKMARIGAINGCLKTYKRMTSSSDFSELNTSNQSVASENETEEDNNNSDKKESIFDRLLSTESNDDVNPMQKMHRTGGK